MGNLDVMERSHKVLPVREKVEGLHLTRKEKRSYTEVAKVHSKNEPSLHEIA